MAKFIELKVRYCKKKRGKKDYYVVPTLFNVDKIIAIEEVTSLNTCVLTVASMNRRIERVDIYAIPEPIEEVMEKLAKINAL